VQRIRLASTLFLSTLLLGMTGCGGGGPRDQLGQIEDEVTVCAKGPTVEGIDVSYYQGTIDWPKVKASGRVFAIARISDGTYMDTKFDANWPAMKSAGLIRGAYQFFEPATDPNVQADIVIKKVGMLGDGDLPVTCDVEATGGQSAATINARLHTWMDAVEKCTG
jgi:lysozyme